MGRGRGGGVFVAKKDNIAFPNLRAEMGRKNLGIGDIAATCGFNRDTLSRKLSAKSPLSLVEAFNIQHSLFPDLDVKYLFFRPDQSYIEE